MLVDDHKRDLALEALPVTRKSSSPCYRLMKTSMADWHCYRTPGVFWKAWPELAIIVITVDSPSSLLRCRQEHGLPGVSLLSTLRGRDFHKQYGVLAMGYPLSGYTAPSILIADGDNLIHYAERLHNSTGRFNQHAISALLTAGPEQDTATPG
jgi:thiol peroxidase